LGQIRDSARLLQKLNTWGCKPQSDSADLRRESSVLNAAKSVAAPQGFPAFSLRAATGEKLARMLSCEKASGGNP
jgi:hypothetical protein